jgi:hypothetical protein
MKTAFASRTSQSLGRGALRSGTSPAALPDGTNQLKLQNNSTFWTSRKNLSALEQKPQASPHLYQNNYNINTFER